MVEATVPATTTKPRRPARNGVAASKAAVTPAAVKTAPAKSAPATATAVNVTRFQVELEHGGTTKSYEKFAFPDSYKGVAVGNVYAPIGTSRVVVLVIGSDDTETPEA